LAFKVVTYNKRTTPGVASSNYKKQIKLLLSSFNSPCLDSMLELRKLLPLTRDELVMSLTRLSDKQLWFNSEDVADFASDSTLDPFFISDACCRRRATWKKYGFKKDLFKKRIHLRM